MDLQSQTELLLGECLIVSMHNTNVETESKHAKKGCNNDTCSLLILYPTYFCLSGMLAATATVGSAATTRSSGSERRHSTLGGAAGATTAAGCAHEDLWHGSYGLGLWLMDI